MSIVEDELQELVGRMIERLPQGDRWHRTAAFFALVARASGCTEDETAHAVLRMVRTERNMPYARLSLARADGVYVLAAEDSGPFGEAG